MSRKARQVSHCPLSSLVVSSPSGSSSATIQWLHRKTLMDWIPRFLKRCAYKLYVRLLENVVLPWNGDVPHIISISGSCVSTNISVVYVYNSGVVIFGQSFKFQNFQANIWYDFLSQKFGSDFPFEKWKPNFWLENLCRMSIEILKLKIMNGWDHAIAINIITNICGDIQLAGAAPCKDTIMIHFISRCSTQLDRHKENNTIEKRCRSIYHCLRRQAI